MTHQENGITQGVIWKQLLIFFFPILFGTFFQQLYNTADAMIVGRFVGKEALAAVGGSTSVLINLLVNLFVGLSAGATVVTAQFFGAQRFEDVSRTVQTSMALAVTAGGGMTIIGLAAAPAALRAMGTPPEIMEGAVTYLRVYFWGIIAAFIYNIGSAILRAVGDTRRPLYFLIVACLLNIVLDLLLVVWLGLGVLGVGIATVISQIVSAALVVAALRRSDYFDKLTLRSIRFSPAILKGILKVGIPAGVQSDMYSISNLILQACVNSFGTNVIAAYAATGKIDGFFWMVMSAYGIAITTFVGQNFGARQYDRVKRSVRICLAMAMGTAIAVGVLFYFFSEPLFGLFGDDPEVIEIGAHIMRSLCVFYTTYVCVDILSGAIRGAGEALWPMLITCGGICVFRVLWVFFVLPLRWNLDMVLISYPISWALTSLIFIVYYLRGGWLRKQIAKQSS